jgi:hypothetical protein
MERQPEAQSGFMRCRKEQSVPPKVIEGGPYPANGIEEPLESAT